MSYWNLLTIFLKQKFLTTSLRGGGGGEGGGRTASLPPSDFLANWSTKDPETVLRQRHDIGLHWVF